MFVLILSGPVTGKRADSQAWSQMEARRPGPTQKSDVPATPTPARRDARADADLCAACRAGKLAEVKRILDTGRADVNCRSVVGMTPVMRAAGWGHRDVVELLVSRGADVSLVDDDGDNVLHYACEGGYRKTVEFVLSLDGVDINSRGQRSMTPVMLAALRGHRDVVEFLVSRGADVSLVDGVGNDILHYACRGGDRKTVEFVLSLDGVDINVRNDYGETAADVARDGRHHQLSDLLVSRGTQ
ncbi:ankyrin repeat domain-containing protein 29-like isoform X2 [Haliotis rubra]|uniref:ankyrin repeat domain-containing protein 29-like isoform X2 n=1 Tax=Haliotis rubra TaxID=36100 RepID=UPI001EE50D9E|nr:ankyrin repeat domain-containing protein 29-like isoform X2 [Haliotis rubra]